MVNEGMISRDDAIGLLLEASSRTGLPHREIIKAANSAFQRRG
jgi:hypothetical protein